MKRRKVSANVLEGIANGAKKWTLQYLYSLVGFSKFTDDDVKKCGSDNV